MIDRVVLLTAKLQGLQASGLFRDERGANWLGGGAPYYGVYERADGRHLAIGALEADFYRPS